MHRLCIYHPYTCGSDIQYMCLIIMFEIIPVTRVTIINLLISNFLMEYAINFIEDGDILYQII